MRFITLLIVALAVVSMVDARKKHKSVAPKSLPPQPKPKTTVAPCTTGNYPLPGNGLTADFCLRYMQGVNVLTTLDAVRECASTGQHVCTVNEFLNIPTEALDGTIESLQIPSHGISFWADSTGYNMPPMTGETSPCRTSPDDGVAGWSSVFVRYTPASTEYPGTGGTALGWFCNNQQIAWACCGPQQTSSNTISA